VVGRSDIVLVDGAVVMSGIGAGSLALSSEQPLVKVPPSSRLVMPTRVVVRLTPLAFGARRLGDAGKCAGGSSGVSEDFMLNIPYC
jgi:hypothetical protein